MHIEKNVLNVFNIEHINLGLIFIGRYSHAYFAPTDKFNLLLALVRRILAYHKRITYCRYLVALIGETPKIDLKTNEIEAQYIEILLRS